jgi:hypothetical protein
MIRADPPIERSVAEPAARDVGQAARLPATSAARIQPERPRTARMELAGPRDRSVAPRSGGPVEVRIGTVTLQVRSPPPVAPLPPAPAAPSGPGDTFSPYRHYLRGW